MARIYVASSWRNIHQPGMVKLLREYDHEVYDFQHPPNSTGFSWEELDPNWVSWTPGDFRSAIETHPRAAQGFMSDFRAMQWAELCVMVLPCGPSAHLEAGWFTGAGKRCFIYIPDAIFTPFPVELMYLLCTKVCLNKAELLEAIGPALTFKSHHQN